MTRSDHPNDSRKRGVCIYYKDYISFITRHDICILDNCLVTEISLQNEKCFSSQRQDKLENFCTSFYIVLNQINDELPICSIVSSNFNARCSSWWRNDTRNSTGQEVDFLTSPSGFTKSHLTNPLMS